MVVRSIVIKMIPINDNIGNNDNDNNNNNNNNNNNDNNNNDFFNYPY